MDDAWISFDIDKVVEALSKLQHQMKKKLNKQ